MLNTENTPIDVASGLKLAPIRGINMSFPRFFPDQVLNNVALTAGAAAILLLITLGSTAVLWRLVHRATRSVSSDIFKIGGEQVQKSLRFVATVMSLLIVLASCATFAIAIIRDIDMHPWAISLGGYVTAQTGPGLLQAIAIVVAVIVGWLIVRAGLKAMLDRVEAKLSAISVIEDQKDHIPIFRRRIASLADVAFLYILHRALSLAWLGLSPSIYWLLDTVLYVLLIVNIARAAASIAVLSLGGLDNLTHARFEQSHLKAYYLSVRKLLPLGKRILEAITYLAGATLIVRQFQTLEVFAPYGPRIIRLLGTFFASRVTVELVRVILVETFAPKTELKDETFKHRATLSATVTSARSSISRGTLSKPSWTCPLNSTWA